MGRLKGKVAVVTGGASGIGRACAVAFADEGAEVVVADINDRQGKETVAGIARAGARAVFSPLDVREKDAVEATMDVALDRFGRLDVLLTSASITHSGQSPQPPPTPQNDPDPATNFFNLPLPEWATVLDVNLTGTFLAVQAAGRRMAASGGSIITIGSIASKAPEAGRASYCVSKAGVWMLTKWAAMALAASGIRVNAIAPGIVDTPLIQAVHDDPSLKERALARVPMKRFASVADIAHMGVFLASDEAAYVTGEMFNVDGGYYTD